MYKELFEEVESVNKAFGWVGCLDAIMYIESWKEEYSGKVQAQLRMFMNEGARLFAPAKEAA